MRNKRRFYKQSVSPAPATASRQERTCTEWCARLDPNASYRFRMRMNVVSVVPDMMINLCWCVSVNASILWFAYVFRNSLWWAVDTRILCQLVISRPEYTMHVAVCLGLCANKRLRLVWSDHLYVACNKLIGLRTEDIGKRDYNEYAHAPYSLYSHLSMLIWVWL